MNTFGPGITSPARTGGGHIDFFSPSGNPGRITTNQRISRHGKIKRQVTGHKQIPVHQIIGSPGDHGKNQGIWQNFGPGQRGNSYSEDFSRGNGKFLVNHFFSNSSIGSGNFPNFDTWSPCLRAIFAEPKSQTGVGSRNCRFKYRDSFLGGNRNRPTERNDFLMFGQTRGFRPFRE